MPKDAGYSRTPLPKKLGIKEGHQVCVLHAPKGFLTELALPVTVQVTTNWPEAQQDVVLFFTKEAGEMCEAIPVLKKSLQPAGGLWIAWPKKASKVLTDITEDVVRAAALRCGLVDNKVCAIDAIWSGLRLVIRLIDREPDKRTPPRK